MPTARSARATRAGKAAKAAATANAVPRGIVRPAAPPARTVGIRVRATDLGYYDHTRRRVGDVFTIRNEQEFSTRWMERVSASTPEKITPMTEALKRQQQEIAGVNGPEGSLGMLVGPDDVSADLPSGARNPIDAD